MGATRWGLPMLWLWSCVWPLLVRLLVICLRRAAASVAASHNPEHNSSRMWQTSGRASGHGIKLPVLASSCYGRHTSLDS